MNKNHIDQNSQNTKEKSNQSAPGKKKEFQEKQSELIDPKENDPTRTDKLPLIISKL